MQQLTKEQIERDFADRINVVMSTISDAARAGGRSPDDELLVAVCKTVDRAAVDLGYRLGLRDFGENRVQDALEKFEVDVPEDLGLHMIGSLQTNKANQVVKRFALIHSLDRLSLAKALDKRATQLGVVQPVLIQVNVSREDQKHGCAVEDIPQLLDEVLSLSGLSAEGFMTMASFVATPEQARPVFAEMREIKDAMRARYPDVPLRHLSMGMTNDYAVAIEEGATIVRVGRALFQDSVA
ncbi:MAG: YggS family pyridoxal phosphate-dependent enzyme [Chloroflexia bacterium]|nr:YggS family pyridoxal phosphate-dependent enzyme [Chloroflexia bacterium]